MKNLLFFLLSLSISFQSFAFSAAPLGSIGSDSHHSSPQGQHDCDTEIEDIDDLEEKEFHVESVSRVASNLIHSNSWEEALYKMPFLERDIRPPRS